jgi:aryl-alcohol dehydrogenase-like predicted oxidoreductase
MEEGRKAGKCKYLGLSECSAETLRRACKVAKIDAVQTEYSPWTLDIEENGVLEACRELGVALVAYSPLGRGFLTGKYKSPEDFEEGDFRRMTPRFSKENFPKNLEVSLSAYLILRRND